MAGIVTFTKEQTAQLLRPIAPQRVLSDSKGHSHVSQQDVTAHLIRIFGFGSFDTDLAALDVVFERERMKDGKPADRWDVCYRAVMRLTIRDANGQEVCHYEDGSTATAQNQTLGDAHDLAMKSAISLAKKRTMINLGDQFGLSLYNKGQKEALVRGTLVMPEATDAAAGDVQEGVPQQMTLGDDETEHEPTHHTDTPPDPVDPGPFHAAIAAAGNARQLLDAGHRISNADVTAEARAVLRAEFGARMAELKDAAKQEDVS